MKPTTSPFDQIFQRMSTDPFTSAMSAPKQMNDNAPIMLRILRSEYARRNAPPDPLNDQAVTDDRQNFKPHLRGRQL